MRILLIHNHYQHAGGEDVVFAAEASLLRQNGHEVVEYTEDNNCINNMSRIAVAAHTLWSSPVRCRLLKVFHDTRYDIAHFHNTFPLISPAAYSACREAGIPVVQTLHNYRLLCPAATFFRDGRLCEDCLGKTPPWPGVRHACYRKSHVQTMVVAAMLTFHRWLKTWQEQVDVYIALTAFSQKKFIEGGLPAEKIVVKPNFVPREFLDHEKREGNGQYMLFVGRLSSEKGIRTLLRAWQRVQGIPLKVIGDGQLMDDVRTFVQVQKQEGIEVLGRRTRAEVGALMRKAQVLVFPSEWYEGLPVTIAEAFACGVPVIASRVGAMAELVEDGRTGLHFKPGDPEDLAAKLEWAWRNPDEIQAMGREARAEFEKKYTDEHNYRMLIEIYRLAVERHIQAKTNKR